jgi:hypothetical protein
MTAFGIGDRSLEWRIWAQSRPLETAHSAFRRLGRERRNALSVFVLICTKAVLHDPVDRRQRQQITQHRRTENADKGARDRINAANGVATFYGKDWLRVQGYWREGEPCGAMIRPEPTARMSDTGSTG